ncbi:hypothetical protein CN378_13850 [Bacillus sp. AFS015802]|nr:hypothetical protein CN378_13850 [Bacillus sp. AFS015802]
MDFFTYTKKGIRKKEEINSEENLYKYKETRKLIHQEKGMRLWIESEKKLRLLKLGSLFFIKNDFMKKIKGEYK